MGLLVLDSRSDTIRASGARPSGARTATALTDLVKRLEPCGRARQPGTGVRPMAPIGALARAVNRARA